jgi:two-component system response regulator FixJ
MVTEPVVHVIDDDDSARDSLAFLLDCAGLQVQSYPSAIAFLEAVPGMAHGCIVSDVRMPEVNGVEMVAKLKEMGVPDPVIIITGHADVPMAIEAMKKGVSDFIEKPFSDEVILTAVHTALAEAGTLLERQAQQEMIRSRIDSLSQREREVLDGLVEGKANKVIAFDLEISARTVEVYRANVMAKMRARSLSELVRMAILVAAD